MSRADEDSNELDSLFSTNDETSADDDFLSSLGDSADSANDEASDPFAVSSGEEGEESASLEIISDASPFDSDSNVDETVPFVNEDSVDSLIDASVNLDKKGKKTKAPKVKKERAPKVKGESVRYGSPFPFFVLGAFFLLLIVAGNIAAFATAGMGAISFLVFFDLFGLALLLVPVCLLWQQTKQRVGLFDVAIALVAAFLTIGCMAILAYQAKTYGASSKVASAAPAVVQIMERV